MATCVLTTLDITAAGTAVCVYITCMYLYQSHAKITSVGYPTDHWHNYPCSCRLLPRQPNQCAHAQIASLSCTLSSSFSPGCISGSRKGRRMSEDLCVGRTNQSFYEFMSGKRTKVTVGLQVAPFAGAPMIVLWAMFVPRTRASKVSSLCCLHFYARNTSHNILKLP
jgi:hypothetical protein